MTYLFTRRSYLRIAYSYAKVAGTYGMHIDTYSKQDYALNTRYHLCLKSAYDLTSFLLLRKLLL